MISKQCRYVLRKRNSAGVAIIASVEDCDLERLIVRTNLGHREGTDFRLLAKVMADGHEVAQELVKAGLAVPYNGQGKKKDWCEAPPA